MKTLESLNETLLEEEEGRSAKRMEHWRSLDLMGLLMAGPEMRETRGAMTMMLKIHRGKTGWSEREFDSCQH